MFTNIHTRTKILINLLLSQLGFAAISIVAILSDEKIIAIITVNLLFGILITYTNYAAMRRIVGGIERLKKYMDDLMEFVFFRTNRVQKAQFIKKDDIGFILKELNIYSDKFDEMRKKDMHVLGEVVIALNKLSQGIYTTRIHSNTDNFMIHALKKVINEMLETMDKNMSELVNVVELYTNHDYRAQMKINPILKGKMLATMQRINQLGLELNNNAKMNLKNGELLKHNSINMNQSVENLANKANEQAASLEQTAASVEEITSITKENAANAAKMEQLSKTVKSSVSTGETLANKTAIAMDEINTQVISINDAITLIDQIAFQTNILSLNAAVEAATAGEAGKGFAVVAQEVRNLASRSTEAAKEIKNLVENATAKANDGKKISDEMIIGYKRLNEHISQTVDIINNVSTSSMKQLEGLEQINSSISMLDKVTQENANEASKVATISNETLAMADKLAQEAKTKKVN
ncbi:MAG: methyl-accepting chemotaxis protein [Candidatus Marinarcus sp.]|uniref:methyl-accepting chemotaxis protein n=1 Tax=Candidatus Marinarcus sp. TaxID=3100987 RepID=UPI003B006C85